MKLDFYFDDQPAGYFLETEDYPCNSGRYRYMPYRSGGHLRMHEESKRNGFALCTYTTQDSQKTFIVRSTQEYGVIDVEVLGRR
jgi:hypothetical protein